MDSIKRNQLLRAHLAESEEKASGSRIRGERVAVYAVAVGERLGLGVDALVRLRILAELSVGANPPAELLDLAARDPLSVQIVKMCHQFLGFEPDLGLDWLKGQSHIESETRIVEALIAVQNVVQPLGT